MMTLKQVSKRTGVSIRTLQYYDKIGLLKATAHTEAGYRLCDDAALEQLQRILLFRELEFPLNDIGQIKDGSPESNAAQSLVQKLQQYITEYYYSCNDQILNSLGQMYTAGGAFRQNIDAAGGSSTADFIGKAISLYCTL